MQLRDVIEQLDDLEGELIIYAERGIDADADSRVLLAEPSDDGSPPAEAAGLGHYAKHDAYPQP